MLRIGGFTPLSTTDWPGMLAAVVFCQGCPWRCRYCHNPGLIPARGEREVSWEFVRRFLQRRQGLLDAVVFSGGEPTLQTDLLDALGEVRGRGFKIGLHTGGAYPQQLATILPLLDWVGMDVKAPFADYPRLTGAPGSGEKALASLDLVLQSGVEYEIRTTVHPALLDDQTLQTLADDLRKRGVSHYVIQAFRSRGCADEFLNHNTTRKHPLTVVGQEIAPQFARFATRHN